MRETESSRNLYEIAEPQYGFFTTKQADEAGYDESKHAYHVRAGRTVLCILLSPANRGTVQMTADMAH
jgi:hypothetical protein